MWAMDEALAHPERSIDDVLARFRRLSDEDEAVLAVVRRVAADARGLDGRPADVLQRWAMGEVMRELMGRVAPDRVTSLLENALSQEAAR